MTDVLEQTPPEPLPAPAGAHEQAPEPPVPGWLDRLAHRVGSISLEGWITFGIVVGAVVFTLAELHPDLLFSNSTPTGGDMGAHVWGPAYLRDHLLPHFRLSGWAPDWYAGFPMYQFYMVIPALAVVLVNLILPYGLALKLVSIAGVLTLPIAAWAFGKLSGLKFPVPALFAALSVIFLFDESFTIYGGNIASTMAGEFSFSIALSIAFVYFGVLARGLRTGRLRALAAVLLALCVLCHLIVAIFAAAGTVVLVPAVRGPAPVQVAGHDVARRCPAHRVLGDAVLPSPPLPDRHGLRAAHRLREHALPVHVEVGCRAVRARSARPHRLGRPPAAHRHLARAHDADLRRVARRVAAEHVLERAAHSLLLHLPLPPCRDRRRRDRAVARVDCGAAGRAGGEARRHVADAGRRRGHLRRHPRPEPAHPSRRPPRHQRGRRHRVQLARPREHESGVRRRLGEVELRGVRGQARVRRVPRRHDDDGRRRQDKWLWARRVGVRRGAEPVRHADGDDVAAVLDRRLHRLDGGSVLRVVGHDAVSLPRQLGAVRGAVTAGAQPPLRPAERGQGRAVHAAAGRQVLHGVLAGRREGGSRADRSAARSRRRVRG